MNKKNEIDVSAVITILVNNKKNIFYICFLGLVLSILYLYIATPYYKSYVSITPMGQMSKGGGSSSGLQSLVSDFGVNVNISDIIGDKPSFHIPDIVNSRVLKKAVINNKWNTIEYDSIDLINYWKIGDSTKFSLGKIIKKISGRKANTDLRAKYMEIAIDKLNSQISIQKEESGLIVVSVLMEEPQLAADIANYIANYIKEYVSDKTFAHSIKQRKFIEERLEYSKKELSKSEEEFKEFSEKNSLIDTPELQLQKVRLVRNMEVNQQVYITLRNQYEVARITELKEVPVINILDQGEPASEKSKPRSLFLMFTSMVLSLFLSSIYFILKEEIKVNN